MKKPHPSIYGTILSIRNLMFSKVDYFLIFPLLTFIWLSPAYFCILYSSIPWFVNPFPAAFSVIPTFLFPGYTIFCCKSAQSAFQHHRKASAILLHNIHKIFSIPKRKNARGRCGKSAECVKNRLICSGMVELSVCWRTTNEVVYIFNWKSDFQRVP